MFVVMAMMFTKLKYNINLLNEVSLQYNGQDHEA